MEVKIQQSVILPSCHQVIFSSRILPIWVLTWILLFYSQVTSGEQETWEMGERTLGRYITTITLEFFFQVKERLKLMDLFYLRGGKDKFVNVWLHFTVSICHLQHERNMSFELVSLSLDVFSPYRRGVSLRIIIIVKSDNDR